MAVLILVPLAQAAVAGAGTAFGLAGTIGAFLFTTAVSVGAAYLDATYVYPLLFKQKGNDGPRLDDLRVQTATEGSPYQYIIGTLRSGGTLIWASDLLESSNTAGGGKKPKQTSYKYSVDIAISFGAGVRRITQVWANGKKIYDLNIGGAPKYDVRYTDIRIYSGANDQPVSPLIEGHKGSGNVSAYRGTCYVTIEGLQLADFGQAIPQFQALVEQDITDGPGVLLTDGIDTVFQLAGWDSAWYDLSGIDPTKVLHGMTIAGVFDLSKALEPLLLAYRLVMRETAGVIEIMERDAVDTLAITEDEMGTHTQQPVPAYKVTDKANKELPTGIDIRFLDPTHAYDQGMKAERSPVFISNNITSVDLPIAMQPHEARTLAMVMLHSGFVEAQTIETTFGPRMMILQEQDLLTRTIGARTRTLRATEVTRGWNSMVEVSGYFEQPNSQTGNLIDYDPGDDQPPPLDYTVPYLHVLDIGPVSADTVGTPGVLIGASRPGGADKFRSVTVYGSPDGTTYEEAVTCNTEAIMGNCDSILGDQPAWAGATPEPQPRYSTARDDVSTLTVTLWSSAQKLATVTDTQCINGRNWMLVGDEIIGFVEVTPLGGGSYALSKLYRGLLNTQHACATHGASEIFCVLNGALRFAPIPITYRKSTIHYKGVPLYGDPDAFGSFTQVWRAENVKTFRPFGVNSVRTGTDIKITWNRDTRIPKPAATYGGAADEAVIEFKIAIWEAGADTATTAPLRIATITMVSTTDPMEWTYTAADQTVDGRTPGDPIKIRIAQRGSFVATGRFAILDNL